MWGKQNKPNTRWQQQTTRKHTRVRYWRDSLIESYDIWPGNGSRSQLGLIRFRYLILIKIKESLIESQDICPGLPRWLSRLRHSAHRLEWSAGGAGFNPRVGR